MRFCLYLIKIGLLFGFASVTSKAWSDEIEIRLPKDVPAQVSCEDAYSYAEEVIQQADLTLQYSLHVQALNEFCFLPTSDISLADAYTSLGERDFSFEISGDIITLFENREGRAQRIIVRSPKTEEVTTPKPGGIMPWRDLGDSIWTSRWRMAHLDEAILYKGLFARTTEMSEMYRGPNVSSVFSDVLVRNENEARGVTKHVLYSPQLKEERRLNLYRPDISNPEEIQSILYLADGDDIFSIAALLDEKISAGKIAPLYVVGIASGNDSIVSGGPENWIDVRSADYAPAYDPTGRFDKHLAFLTQTIIPWAEEVTGFSKAGERMIAGYSNGAVFSLYAAATNPDLFQGSMVFSPGWRSIDVEQISPTSTKFHFTAGLYEPRFHASARSSAQTLKEAGIRADLEVFSIGHVQLHLPALLTSKLESLMLNKSSP